MRPMLRKIQEDNIFRPHVLHTNREHKEVGTKEMNIEYRFTFFNSLKSAIFIDAGNIWSIKHDQNDGSAFKIENFI